MITYLWSIKTMAEEQFLYRFRALDKIFEYNELENQEIYFASPEEFNDPMECYINLVFNGDEIAWHNLFKHYLMCLYLTINEICITSTKNLSFFKEPTIILSCIDNTKHTCYKQTFYDIYEELRTDDELNKIINELKNIEITKYQLNYILLILNRYLIKLIKNTIFKVDDTAFSTFKQITYTSILSLINEIKVNNIQFHTLLDSYNNFIALTNHYNIDKNYIFMYDKFPNQYVEWLPKLLTQYNNIACFTKHFNNSYMWGVYGDKNNGICLIYKVSNDIFYIHDEEHKKKKEEIEYEIKPVEYGKKYAKINFFEYNYQKFYKIYNNFWYTDYISKKKSKFYFDKAVNDNKELEISHELEQLYKENNETILNNYSKKTIEWAYEEEYRIIIQTKEKIYKYNFHDLYGIIFGIGTPFDAKQKIVNIILEKCKENGRNIKDFHFYQAYFDPDKNQIEKYEIEDISIYTPHGA